MSAPFERKGFGGRGEFPKKKKDDGGLRVNREIRAQQIRVIDDEGKMLGVMTVPEGIKLAEERGLDLLEIAPTAAPPTCRIMDYGKWKYENKKKLVQARKNQIIIQTKELQLRPRTDKHDFDTKMSHARRFILEGDKVKVTLRFMGREMAHQELGIDLLKKVVEVLNDVAMAEVNPKMEGRNAYLILAPDPMKVKEYLKIHPQKAKPEAADEESEEAGDDDPEQEEAH